MFGLLSRLLGSVLRLMMVSLVIVGVVATGGFAGVGPLADELAVEDPPFEGVSSPIDGSPDFTLENLSVEQDAEVVDEQRVERLIHEEINERRRAHGEEPLTADEGLQRIARKHSHDMATRDYVGHESPNGVTPTDRLSAVGCGFGGENVAQSWISEPVRMDGETVVVENESELANHLVRGWMNSPGHRENVLRDSFEYSGVGVIIDKENRVYATQNFCGGPTNVRTE